MILNDPKLVFYHDATKEEINSLQANALHILETIQKVIVNREEYHNDDKTGVKFSKNILLLKNSCASNNLSKGLTT